MTNKDKIKSELFKIIQDHFEELVDIENDFTDADKVESMLFLVLNILSNTSIFPYDLELIVKTEEGDFKINENLQDDYFNSTLNI